MSDSKSHGGFTSLKVVEPGSYDKYAAEYRTAIASGLYDERYSYISESGAYVLYEKGHEYHLEEIEAAKALADNGIIVEMGKEGDPVRATAIDGRGNYKFSEGTLTIERFTYEQSTRTTPAQKAERAVKNSLEHCRKKGAEIAVIYDKGGVFHRGDIARGIKAYEKFSTNAHRFRAILVINQTGNVYEWQHAK